MGDKSNIINNGQLFEALIGLDWSGVTSKDINAFQCIIDSFVRAIMLREMSPDDINDSELAINQRCIDMTNRIEELKERASTLGVDAEEIFEVINGEISKMIADGYFYTGENDFNQLVDKALKTIGGKTKKLTPEKESLIVAEFIRRRSKTAPDSKEAIYRDIQKKTNISRRTVINFLKNCTECAPYL